MPKSILLFLVYFLLTFELSAQSQSVINEAYIDKKLEEIRFDTVASDGEKEKALINLKSESEKIKYNPGILKSGSQLINLYLNQNKNEKVIELATKLKKISADDSSFGIVSNIYRINALALGYLGFNEASLKDFKTAILYADKTKNPDVKNYLLALAYENLTVCYNNKRFESKEYRDSIIHYLNKGIDAAKLIKNNSSDVKTDSKYDHIAFINMRFGIFYLEQSDIQLAEKYLTESFNIVNKYHLDSVNKVMLLNQLSWLYLEKKDYQKTIEYANSALNLEKKYHDPYHRCESFEFLAGAYTAIGNKEKAGFYMDEYSYLKDSIRLAEKTDTDQSVITMLTDSKKTEEKKSSLKILVISGVSLILLLCAIFYWKRKNKILHKKYEELISQMNIEKKQSEKAQVETHTLKKDEDFIRKLEKFEKSDTYIKQEVTPIWLANYLKTDTKHLSELIKIHRNKTFPDYINGLKIKYIIRKLVTDSDYREYNPDLLAKKCGYNSNKVFINSFKNETGITPSYFIDKLKKDNLYLNL